MPITADKQPPPPPKKGVPSLGLIIFVVFLLWRIFGAQITRLFRTGNLNLSLPSLGSNTLFWIAGAFVVFIFALTIISRLSSGRARGDRSLPTVISSPSMPMSTARQEAYESAPGGLPTYKSSPTIGRGPTMPPSYMPRPPRYERAFNGKVLLASVILGGFLFGGVFFMLLTLGLI